MSLGEMFASIRERRRCSAEKSSEEGAQIMRRLQELLGGSMPTQNVEVPPRTASSETDPT